MESKERLLMALKGQKADRLPWAPFLSYWWEHNGNREAVSLGELGFKRAAACDLLMRGHYDRKSRTDYRDLFVFRHAYEETKVIESADGSRKEIAYQTPVGTLRAGYAYSQAANTWFLQEHPVRNERDLKTLAHLAHSSELTPWYEGFAGAQAEAPDALFLPLVTPFAKTALQSMIEFWVGTENMAYALADYPKSVHEAMEAMQEVSIRAAHLCAASPAEAFISWEDTSTTNISPQWYEDYILPEINAWCGILHAAGKLYVQHACGHIRALIPAIAESRIDAIESVAGRPTGDVDVRELKDMLPDRIAVIGGIEPTFFAGADDAALEERIESLLEQFDGKRFVLANADSCPPAVDINRFGFVSRVVSRLTGGPDLAIHRF